MYFILKLIVYIYIHKIFNKQVIIIHQNKCHCSYVRSQGNTEKNVLGVTEM